VLTVPDREVFLAARAGEPAAFDRLVEPFRPAVFTIGLWLADEDRSYAERLHRRTFMLLHRRLHLLESEEEVAVAVYRALADSVRRRPKAGRRGASLRAAVAGLPTREALALALAGVAGLRHDAIAAVVGIDAAEARQLLYGARDAARRHLDVAELMAPIVATIAHR
jgi:DNA-directed RNA polymerase specialized sigma24 family protein